MPVFHAKAAMWSRKQSVCSAVSGASRGDDVDLAGNGIQLYPFAIGLRVRVLQIVCGIGGLVLGAVGWLEERQKPALGLGVPAGAITVLAAATSIYYSRGFGGWVSARSRTTTAWGAPWRALGPSPCAAVPLTMLWTAAIGAHIAMLAFCVRSLLNIGCGSTTCIGVASSQLTLSITTLGAAVFMFQLDLRYDASLSPPPRQSDTHICTAVSMVPLTSVAINSGNSDVADPGGSPQGKEKEPPPLEPPT
ncbi:uncharacterized protein LOC113508253 [Trichoplusia ni]|uniref:Uncharacterized protein LOC113496874 n=1 Tax=Trichoplusia ni TaxID=7111 RepID=A0A7E5X2X1_TRINI|nr:uncharacterized protein LOC113496874 [Trichoplusia ni]XP_026747009.1 uncharacterized protein LOC113508253 [Trichoplusia ni]